MQVIYSTERVPHMYGREFRNPRHFLAPVEGATKVYVAGDWPLVVRAYEKAGVPVAPIEEMQALPKAKAAASAPKQRKAAAATPATSEPEQPRQ